MYQIKIDKNRVSNKKFYSGAVFSSRLIDKSISRGKMIKTLTSFNVGLVEDGIPQKSLFKKEYTFIEVLKMFEIAEAARDPKKLCKPPAWNNIVKKFILPGRPAESLAGTYKKFARHGKNEALRTILRKGRFSHFFQYPPSLMKESSMEKTPSTQMSANTVKDMSPCPANLISDEEDSKESENSENEEEEEFEEFYLAVDDLESVLSYRDTNDLTYNMQTNIRKIDSRNLDEAFTQLDEDSQYQKTGFKRVKISEQSEISQPVYDDSELRNYCEEVDRISLLLKVKEGVRLISKSTSKTMKLKFFNDLKDQLKKISRDYARDIRDIHMLFLEVSCDLPKLIKVLENDPKAIRQKWSPLEDMALQKPPKAPEYFAIRKEKGDIEVEKRKAFLGFD